MATIPMGTVKKKNVTTGTAAPVNISMGTTRGIPLANSTGVTTGQTAMNQMGGEVVPWSNGVLGSMQGGAANALVPGSINTNGGAGAGTDAQSAALRAQLKSRLTGRGGEINDAYNSLFGSLDDTLRSSDADLEKSYGDQLQKATTAYVGAIPEIENSYASIGAADSTDRSDAKTKAKTGFDDTTKAIGDNKVKDQSALGKYGAEQRAKITADRDSANRLVQSAADTTDVDALRSANNTLDENLGQAGVTRATLTPDGSARQQLKSFNNSSAAGDEAINALDSVLKSSLSGDVKTAAVKAVVDNGGLDEAQKKRVTQMFGNTYAEQAAL